MNTMSLFANTVKKMTGSVTTFDKKLVDSNRKLVSWGKNALESAVLTHDSSNIVIQAALEMGQPFFQLEEQMAKLEITLKASGKNQATSLLAAKQAALDWQKQHLGSAASFIEMTNKMNVAGLSNAEAIKATQQALTLATATASSANTAGELLVLSYQKLGDKSKNAAEEMRKHADVSAKVQQIYALGGLDNFTEAMKQAVPAAALFRQNYEAAAVAVSVLEKAGWQGSESGSAYTQILGQLESASSTLGFTLVKNAADVTDFVATIDEISSKYGDLNKVTPELQEKLQSTFGDEGLHALKIYQQQSGQMREAMEKLKSSAGAATEACGNVENKGFAKIRMTVQQLDGLKMKLMEKIFGNPKIMDEILPKFIAIAEWATNLCMAFIDANPNITAGFIAIGVVATALLSMAAPIAAVVGTLLLFAPVFNTMFFVAGKFFGAIKVFVLGLVKALTILWGLLKFVFIAAAGVLGIPTAGLVAGVLLLVGTITLMIVYWDELAEVAAQVWETIKINAFAAVNYLKTCWEEICVFASLAWEQILTAASVAWEGIKTTVSGVVDYFKRSLAEMSAAASVAWAEITSSGMDFLMSVPSILMEFFNSQCQVFYDAGAKLWTTFADGIASVLNVPLEKILQGLNLFVEYLPHSDAKKGPLSTLTSSGSSLLTTFAAGIPSGYNAVTKAISGGLALINLPASVDGPGLSFDNSLDAGYADWQSIGSASMFSGSGQGAVHFHAPITIQVEKMDKPEEFMSALKILAAESGG